MIFNLSPGIIIASLGLLGMIFSLVDSAGEIGSKIPLVLFFLAIIIIGMIIEVVPKDKLTDTFGENQGVG